MVRGSSAGGATWPRIVAIWCSCRPLICSGVVFTRNVCEPWRRVTVFSRSSQVQTSPVNVSAGAWATAGAVREAQPASGRRASGTRASLAMVFMRREVLQTRCQRMVMIFRAHAGGRRRRVWRSFPRLWTRREPRAKVWPVDDVRRAYATAGITVDQPTAYGTYYRLRCTAWGANVGNVRDRLPPGMAEAPVAGPAGLYAAGGLGGGPGPPRPPGAAPRPPP